LTSHDTRSQELWIKKPHNEKVIREAGTGSADKPLLPKIAFRYCLCERSEAISVYFDEIATHPMGARDDSDSVFLMAILDLIAF